VSIVSEVSIVGFFCEDIREEKSGQETIVGILPDNFAVPQVPGLIPKLGIYIRMHFDAKSNAKEFSVRLESPNSNDLMLGSSDENTVSSAIQDANKLGIPFAGVAMKAVFGPFPIKSYGVLRAIVKLDGVDILCALLNIVPTAPSVSEQPPAQLISSP
jgi:hypothetical protein